MDVRDDARAPQSIAVYADICGISVAIHEAKPAIFLISCLGTFGPYVVNDWQSSASFFTLSGVIPTVTPAVWEGDVHGLSRAPIHTTSRPLDPFFQDS